ncbi:uncharacterized protein LOC121236487 [Juglans microcarpa x Juglans regia]|uniref:uncharacterized protein LOC121236487 n=1 Tax=Juglans microcarpa x Juglans regia TaxID=2249226 RepID=UPI001B7E1CA4|nr:uncharacterized protein LOC121236487 [Juglans microcarpa x Juglans regia]XP_040988864.1 uncharacterized protein LOC121236487 [Juglans microcarpa x Juglans regia]XP_040988865.1 uncharacterized protein LOC121236487 [Juglans microcarpa x Juglans regia]XP_040988866.1 uncharacterized protein LOC121236487 [Juglans microcarpa x Juglans regia]XP_040988867.1 uncharacterized protein LOC121236487 [Juglans microcarpa x Juglans regia]XP_040988868.1 uncharacterized protein LOC121236487 [Juglans microcarp
MQRNMQSNHICFQEQVGYNFRCCFGVCSSNAMFVDRTNGRNEECCSYTSSNRESWGRCSSLGGTDKESSAACTAATTCSFGFAFVRYCFLKKISSHVVEVKETNEGDMIEAIVN